MKTARIHTEPDGSVWLETPYIEEFVDDLKRCIPPRQRKWSKDRKMWCIGADWASEAIELVESFYDRVQFAGDESRTPRPAEPAPANAWAELWLLPGAPPEVIAAAYRAMAKIHHPDHGGDTRAMQLINAAYEEIGGER